MTCRECSQEFKAYNTIERLCPTCRGKKLKEKKDDERKRFTGIKEVVCKNERREETKGAGRKGGGFRERTTKSDKYAIANKSKTQKNKDSVIASLKAERIRKYGPYCESCGSPYDIDLAHLIPKSIRPDLYLEMDNTTLHCRHGCGPALEHLQDIERVRMFLNLETILAYLERADIKRYLRVIEVLKIKDK